MVLALLAGSAAGFIFIRLKDRHPAMRWVGAAIPLLLALMAVQAAAAILNSPAFVWNEIRMARSVALWHGFSLYLDRNAMGPVIGVLHTPVSHCLYLAVAGLHRPTDLLLAGSLLSMLLILVPMGWALWRASGGAGDRLLFSAVAFLFCGFLILQAPGTFHTASMIHTDAAALAFATLAGGVFSNPRKPITVPQVWLAGIACALSAGSKQTMAPLVLGIALFLGCSAGAKMLAHFSGAVLAGGALLFAAILAFVPARAFLFNTVTLASHHPLENGYMELLVKAYRAAKQDALPALFPLLLLGGCQWIAAERRPGLRDFFRTNRWSAFGLAAVALIPASVRATVSVGADVNHLGLVLYLLFVAAAIAIEQSLADSANYCVRPIAWMCAGFGIVVSIAPGLVLNLPARLHHLHENAPEAALRYELRHPGLAYFPCNPLANLLSNGNVYHVDYSVYDRELAGYPLTSSQYQAGLPAGFKLVAIPPGEMPKSYALRDLLQHYARVNDAGLPRWTVFQRLPGG